MCCHSLDDVARPLTCQVIFVHCSFVVVPHLLFVCCGPLFVVGCHVADSDVAPCFLCEKKEWGREGLWCSPQPCLLFMNIARHCCQLLLFV
jgi:hypothetical protein